MQIDERDGPDIGDLNHRDAGFVVGCDPAVAMSDDLRTLVADAIRVLERDTGRAFGTGPHPLFLSVALVGVEVPGLCVEVANIGFNRRTANALRASFSATLADEVGIGFLTTYGQVVGGLPARCLTGTTPAELRDSMLESAGWLPEPSAWDQLWNSIEALVGLARHPRALTHRRRRRELGPPVARLRVEVVEPVAAPASITA